MPRTDYNAESGSDPCRDSSHSVHFLLHMGSRNLSTPSRIDDVTPKKSGPQWAPKFLLRESVRLGIQDAQLERLADGLRAVHHIQLAQDLLHMVLHGERANLED